MSGLRRISYLWKNPEASREYATGVSLHSHTNQSKETLDFLANLGAQYRLLRPVLREAERRWPADAEIANAVGVIQIRRGALDAAVESFQRATTTAPNDALGYFNLARTHQMRLLKSQRYDAQMQKWIGGDEERRRAIANFEKYLRLGGPYDAQAREALASLAWK